MEVHTMVSECISMHYSCGEPAKGKASMFLMLAPLSGASNAYACDHTNNAALLNSVTFPALATAFLEADALMQWLRYTLRLVDTLFWNYTKWDIATIFFQREDRGVTTWWKYETQSRRERLSGAGLKLRGSVE